jgi:hypothetical protein
MSDAFNDIFGGSRGNTPGKTEYALLRYVGNMSEGPAGLGELMRELRQAIDAGDYQPVLDILNGQSDVKSVYHEIGSAVCFIVNWVIHKRGQERQLILENTLLTLWNPLCTLCEKKGLSLPEKPSRQFNSTARSLDMRDTERVLNALQDGKCATESDLRRYVPDLSIKLLLSQQGKKEREIITSSMANRFAKHGPDIIDAVFPGVQDFPKGAWPRIIRACWEIVREHVADGDTLLLNDYELHSLLVKARAGVL